MSAIQRFRIVLDNPTAVFNAGQTVSGRVDFCINKRQEIQGIDLKVTGSSQVAWSEDDDDYRSNETLFYKHFAFVHTDVQSLAMAPGKYRYPFSFQLPSSLPSSFEGQYGHVRYVIKGNVDRRWKSHVIQLPIVVNPIVDLNNIGQANRPTRGTKTKVSSHLFGKSGPITALAWLDGTGYVPGENLLFNARVENHSGKSLSSTKVQLVQYSTFHVRGKYQVSSRVLAEVKRVQVGASETWNRVPIQIPDTIPSQLPFNGNISVNYFVNFVVDPGTFSSNLSVPLAIVIGNVPLRPTGSSPLPEGCDPSTHYSDLPPPSYAECVFTR